MPWPKSDRVVVNFRCNRDIYQAVKQRAAELRVTASEVIRRGVLLEAAKSERVPDNQGIADVASAQLEL